MDREQFISKVLPLQNGWYRVGLSYLKSDAAAKDLVQDVAIKVWEKRKDWHLIENFPAWCMRIAKNRCLDIRKKEKKMVLSISAGMDSVESSFTPYEEVAFKDEQDWVKGILNKLPEPFRSVMMLREMESLSYKEISDALDLSMDQVKSAIYRSRQKLKKIIEGTNII